MSRTFSLTSSYNLAKRIRVSALEMVHRAKASHIASALSIADIMAVLYGGLISYDSNNPVSASRDRFILSKGHACVAVYATLAECGFFSKDELLSYGQDHSVLMNHISHKAAGVEFSTGSLGHGLSFGVGKAIAAKKTNQNWQTVVLISDGELNEGSNWEAMMFAAHHNLDNLIVIVDYNKLQSLTTVEQTLRIEPLADKARAFGWHVHESDGHDHANLHKLLKHLMQAKSNMPAFVIAHTTKGKGISFMENSVDWHYRPPSEKELDLALQELCGA